MLLLFLPQLLSLPLCKELFIGALQNKTHCSISIDHLRLSWLGPQKMDLVNMEREDFQGTIDTLSIGAPLWAVPGLFQLKNLKQIHGDLKLEGGTFQFGPDAKIEEIKISMKVIEGTAHLIASGNGLSLEGTISSFKDLSLRAVLSSFPTLPIARFFSLRHWGKEDTLKEVLGPWINLEASSSIQYGKGFMDLSLHSENVTCLLLGDLNEEFLTLRRPLTATFKLTPELSLWVLRQFNPLFLTGIQSKNPIQLRIEPLNFTLPISSFSLRDLDIGQGTLAMGQVRVRNGPLLVSLISLLKMDWLSQSPEMNIWFAPMSFQLKDGVLYTGRMDTLLADSLHICTWGNINVIDQDLDLFLGLTSELLENSFGIENLPSDYVLKIPITGSTRHPKIGKEAAALKIAALKTMQTTPLKRTAPGKLLQMFTPNEKGVPPARRPFPWD